MNSQFRKCCRQLAVVHFGVMFSLCSMLGPFRPCGLFPCPTLTHPDPTLIGSNTDRSGPRLARPRYDEGGLVLDTEGTQKNERLRHARGEDIDTEKG